MDYLILNKIALHLSFKDPCNGSLGEVLHFL
jgi:hypothetical protein